MQTLFLSSLLLAIAFCAPPGVVTAEAIRRGLARGYRAALLVELGSLVGDATWAVIALIGAAFLIQNLPARLLLGGVGAVFLLYLAWSAFREARAWSIPEARLVTSRKDFVTGALLSLGNPFAVAFWLGAGSSTITASVANPQGIHYLVFFLAFLSGALAWCFFLAGLITWGRRFVTPSFFRWVNLTCGLFLGTFGLRLIWNTLLQMPGIS